METAPPLPLGAMSWRIVNDGVMGGLSRSRVSAAGTALRFEGEVSLANDGGFAAARAETVDTDLSAWDGLEVCADGGGRRFQLRLRTDGAWDGTVYRATFRVPAGGAGVARLPWSAFAPTWRGRELPDEPPLDPARIRQIGVLISDRQEGPFRLQLERIAPYRDGDAGAR